MKESYSNKERELVIKIMEKSINTSPVELSFGYVTDKGHCMNGIVLRKASSSILEMLLKENCVLHLEDGAVHITTV